MRSTPFPAALAAVLLALPGMWPLLGSAAAPTTWEHRVVVPTTALTEDRFIAPNLEAEVNALAAHGFELAAFVGGDAVVLDRMLNRRPAPATGADSAVTPVVMVRPVGERLIRREYRLLHVQESEAVAGAIAPLGAEGWRFHRVELDGGVTHLAFERTGRTAPVEFREFRNRGRQTWMDQLLADADVRARMLRVVPIARGAGIVELGPPRDTPGDVLWLSKPNHQFGTLEARIDELAQEGYRMELVRRRGISELDVLMLKPAGAAPFTARSDLDSSSWGKACSRGVLAGAAIGPDGRIYCAADIGGDSPPRNTGLDLTVRSQPTAGGMILFRGPTCDVEARLRSGRPASHRIAFAIQFQQEVLRAIEPGQRIERALAAVDSQGQARIIAIATDAPHPAPEGAPIDPTPVPPLVAALDNVGSDLMRQRENALNAELALDGRYVWLELPAERSRGKASLLGCVPNHRERELAETSAEAILIRNGLGELKINNRVIIDF